jgi:hypothetical protein
VQLGFAGWGIGKASGKVIVITAALMNDGKTKLHSRNHSVPLLPQMFESCRKGCQHCFQLVLKGRRFASFGMSVVSDLNGNPTASLPTTAPKRPKELLPLLTAIGNVWLFVNLKASLAPFRQNRLCPLIQFRPLAFWQVIKPRRQQDGFVSFVLVQFKVVGVFVARQQIVKHFGVSALPTRVRLNP